jgi:hypothetical protein
MFRASAACAGAGAGVSAGEGQPRVCAAGCVCYCGRVCVCLCVRARACVRVCVSACCSERRCVYIIPYSTTQSHMRAVGRGEVPRLSVAAPPRPAPPQGEAPPPRYPTPHGSHRLGIPRRMVRASSFYGSFHPREATVGTTTAFGVLHCTTSMDTLSSGVRRTPWVLSCCMQLIPMALPGGDAALFDQYQARASAHRPRRSACAQSTAARALGDRIRGSAVPARVPFG